MRSAAATTSVMVSGSGPSSRIDPPSTKGTPACTHSNITPPFTKPASTAAAIDPCRRTSLITRRWLLWPPSVGAPSATETPSDVPSTFDSMSWVANPLPANSTWIQPPRTSRATSGPPPVWIDRRPAHRQHRRSGGAGAAGCARRPA